MVKYETIGPLNPRFNMKVGQYLSNSPPYVQKECLADFFRKLSTGTVRVPCERMNNNDMLISVCGCIIHFQNNGMRVERIEPGVL
jgi:hypothetical protein